MVIAAKLPATPVPPFLQPPMFVASERMVRGNINAYDVNTLPPGTQREMVDILASDRAFSFGILHLPPGPQPKAVAAFMHPRENQTRQYLTPYLLAAGYAVWGQTSRALNNDSDMVHEEIVRDTAAGIRFLKSRGFETIILVGSSGGTSLLSYYQWQATLAPGDRFTFAPHGEVTKFAEEDMPAADLFIAVAPHAGEGMIMLNMLDPAVVDESNPLAIDPELDMFNPANGYRPYPEPSSYDPAWLAQYRRAQRTRARRLDVLARTSIADYEDARAAVDPQRISTPTARRALMSPYMSIYGTVANPSHLDPSIDPNHRMLGSIFAFGHPLRGSYGPLALGRILTPRAWLSTWSGLSAQAEWTYAAEHLTVPNLVITPLGDTDAFPQEQREIFSRIPVEDKTMVELDYAHHYLMLLPEAPVSYNPREKAGEVIVDWLKSRV
ncbi:alpha/beta hydrolase [Nocardia sp. NPDC055053]